MNIHPTAIIHDGANLAPSVEVGPYAIIGPNVSIGEGTSVQAHAFIDGHTTIGKNCKIFPFACVGMPTQDLKFNGGTTYAEIGDGTTLREFSTVHLGTRDGEVTRVGKNCLVMAYCHIAHGCEVGDEVIMSNSAMLAGEVKVEDKAVISGMLGVHQFVRIGTMSMTSSPRITQDVPPYMLVSREPAEVIGLNIVGLQRRGVSEESISALKKAYRIIWHEGLNRTMAIAKVRETVFGCPEVAHLLDFIEKSQRGVIA
ncbi:MAG: acyl-ACP--UDP-N-acetylglucosamine O-acyltransferase [Kiritimatiellae bacterium]|nr:acyl-ACP--UDP-N-acetylglucosamine O-acyltransferase [Kiritimatiellia bacterium]